MSQMLRALPIQYLTVYDEEHVVTYLHPLDAEAQGADWCGSHV
jgi:hypothetical protein